MRARRHPRGGGAADGYLSPPAGTGPALTTCGKLHIPRAARRPRHAEAHALTGSFTVAFRTTAPRHAETRVSHATIAVLKARRPPTRGDARTRTGHVGKGSRSEQGRTGEGQGAPDGEHAGRGARATAIPPARTMRARRTAGTNEKARNRWVSAGSGPALAVRGGGLEPP